MATTITVPQSRTLVQSLDAARFQDDAEREREYDIAQARTETLMSVIFGRTMIIPAGYVADSPAFIRLFLEVDSGLDKHRRELARISSYKPFSIGLEPEFTTYDDFVRAYVHKGARTVVLDDLAAGTQLSPDEFIAGMAQAFLERRWGTIERIGGPGLYFRRIADQFSDERTAAEVTRKAFKRRPYTGTKAGLAQPISAFLERSREKYPQAAALDEINEAIKAVRTDATDLQLRGTWYKPENRARFGESWDIARIWLDYSLNDEFSSRYAVDVPSYFLQEITEDKYPPGLPLAFLGDASLKRADAKKADDEDVQGGTDKIDWDRVWEMVATEPFQRSLQTLNTSIHRAVQEERDAYKRVEAEWLMEDEGVSQIEDARIQRQASVEEAMNAHIDRVLGDLPEYAVESRFGKVYLKMRRNAEAWTKDKAWAKLAGAAAPPVASSIAPTLFLTAMGMPAPVSFGGQLLTSAAGGIATDRIAKFGSRTLSRLTRPTSLASLGLDQEAVRKQVNDVNFWVGASYAYR